MTATYYDDDDVVVVVVMVVVAYLDSLYSGSYFVGTLLNDVCIATVSGSHSTVIEIPQ